MSQSNELTGSNSAETAERNQIAVESLDASALRELAAELIALMRAELRRERERLGVARRSR